MRFVHHYMGRGADFRALILDRDWKPLHYGYYGERPEVIPEKPACYDEMIEMAEVLARDFCFVRVDLYQHEGRPLFGELTFNPGAGFRWFDPRDLDDVMGAYWKLDRINASGSA